MTKIKNTNKTQVPVGNIYIQPGQSVEIENWAVLKDEPVIKAWVKARVLVVETAAKPKAK